MTQPDNLVDKYDRILKLKLAEHDRKIEAQLEKERIIKKMHKDKDYSDKVIHVEFNNEEVSDENGFHFY